LCESLGTAELIRFALGLSVNVSLNILSCLLDITSNIEGITRGFGDGETEVESDNGWNSAESYSMLDLLIRDSRMGLPIITRQDLSTESAQIPVHLA
jgi:hypothetical protein